VTPLIFDPQTLVNYRPRGPAAFWTFPTAFDRVFSFQGLSPGTFSPKTLPQLLPPKPGPPTLGPVTSFTLFTQPELGAKGDPLDHLNTPERRLVTHHKSWNLKKFLPSPLLGDKKRFLCEDQQKKGGPFLFSPGQIVVIFKGKCFFFLFGGQTHGLVALNIPS